MLSKTIGFRLLGFVCDKYLLQISFSYFFCYKLTFIIVYFQIYRSPMMKEIIITFLLLIFTIWVTNCKEMVKQEENFQVNSETTSKRTIHASKVSLKVSTNSQFKVIIDQFTVFIESSSQMSQIRSYYSIFPAFLNALPRHGIHTENRKLYVLELFWCNNLFKSFQSLFITIEDIFCLIITFVNENLAKCYIFYCRIDI